MFCLALIVLKVYRLDCHKTRLSPFFVFRLDRRQFCLFRQLLRARNPEAVKVCLLYTSRLILMVLKVYRLDCHKTRLSPFRVSG
jgi:hypothetical protein